jgi:hypothetical protein
MNGFRLAVASARTLAMVTIMLPAAALAAQNPIDRVRDVGNPTIARLIHDASECSSTFRHLVDRIARTNGLVYIERGACPSHMHACLLMSMTVAGPNRMLRVRVDTRQNTQEVMASIGHELQHAVEALSEQGVTSSALLQGFFERLAGAPSASGTLAFETDEAVRAGDSIADQVRACRSPDVVAGRADRR